MSLGELPLDGRPHEREVRSRSFVGVARRLRGRDAGEGALDRTGDPTGLGVLAIEGHRRPGFASEGLLVAGAEAKELVRTAAGK